MLKLQVCKNITNSCLKLSFFQPRNALTHNLKQVNLFSSSSWSPNYNGRELIEKNRSNRRFSPKSSEGIKEKTYGRSLKSSLNESDQEFLVKTKNDPDSFGDPAEPEIVDEGDLLEEKHFTEQVHPHKKLRTKQYADIIKKFISQRKIKEAIDVLEIRMLKEDKVKPEAYIYNLLLGACGRVGYTKKSFMLYNQMKKRGLKVMGGTYTALFNACANSPWPLTDGLTRAKHLYDIMTEKGYQPNDTNYNAMIKAFGRCGDLPMAFNLVDEMAQKRIPIKDDTINFLLQACITDKDAGFRHSLLVWRKVIEKNIKPSLFTFNLMLRCVRDCELGDLETTQDVIYKLLGGTDDLTALPKPSIISQLKEDYPIQSDSKNVTEIQSEVVSTDVSEEKSIKSLDQRPNLLAPIPHLGSILSLSEVKKPEDRLILLGGFQGFLETMSNYKCTPDIKTFSLLIDCIPSTNAAEKQLIVAMKKLNVQPDIDFYNMLIKKKSLRCDYEGGKEVLITMKHMKFRPNLITYGILAIGCKTKEEALELVQEMKSSSYSLNSAILGAMLHQACYHRAYDYIFEIMELCLREQIPVNKKFLEHLEEFKTKSKELVDEKKLSKKELNLFGVFKARYKTWLTEVQIDESENVHPWQQYRQRYPEDRSAKYKAKDTARFKPRHASLFKVKTSQKHVNKR